MNGNASFDDYSFHHGDYYTGRWFRRGSYLVLAGSAHDLHHGSVTDSAAVSLTVTSTLTETENVSVTWYMSVTVTYTYGLNMTFCCEIVILTVRLTLTLTLTSLVFFPKILIEILVSDPFLVSRIFVETFARELLVEF